MGFRETYEWHTAYVVFPVVTVLSGAEIMVKGYNVVASAVGLVMIVLGILLPLLAYYEVSFHEF
jgi:hypothetical protein